MTGSRKLIALGLALAALVCIAFANLSTDERRELSFDVVTLFGLFCGANAMVHKFKAEDAPK